MSTEGPAIVSAVWEKVDELLGPKQPAGAGQIRQIDSTFTFELYYQDFVNRVRAMRGHFWGAPEAPFAADEEGDGNRKQWIQNLNWRQKGMAPEQGAQEVDRFSGELNRLSSDYALSRWDVEQYIFLGVVPSAPPIRAMVRQTASGPYCLEIRVFSSSVTAKQIGQFYENLTSGHGLPPLFYDQANGGGGAQDPAEAVRAWAILCLTARASMPLEEAAAAWNERYPAMPLAPDAEQVSELRFRADGLFWKAPR